MIYKDEENFGDYDDRRYSPGELKYLTKLDSYLGGETKAMVALTVKPDLMGMLQASFREQEAGNASSGIDAGFLALRELSRKASFADKIGLTAAKPLNDADTESSNTAALKNSTIVAGSYLVSHPLLTGYFSR